MLKRRENNEQARICGLSESQMLSQFFEAVTKFQDNNMKEDVTSATLPPHDPMVPVGKICLLFFFIFIVIIKS